MLTLAQIGCGYWGPNLLRNFSALPNCRVKYVAEQSEERRDFVTRNYPRTTPICDLAAVLGDAEVDAVIIATPAASHYSMARQALLARKHVFVEKPLAMTTTEADDLAEVATTRERTIMVGHTFLYNAAVEYLKRLVSSGELGQIYYVYAQRLNLGVVRHDVNALWNLAPHDVSIINYILSAVPVAVSATGTDYLQRDIADVVFMNMTYADKVRASVQVSWLDPHKVRRLTVVGSRKMVVYDDVADDKVAIFDKGIDCYTESRPFDEPGMPKLIYRTGDVLLPRIEFVEPIRVQARHFLECVETGRQPKSGVQNGREVVAVLEAATASLRSNGVPVAVSHRLLSKVTELV